MIFGTGKPCTTQSKTSSLFFSSQVSVQGSQRLVFAFRWPTSMSLWSINLIAFWKLKRLYGQHHLTLNACHKRRRAGFRFKVTANTKVSRCTALSMEVASDARVFASVFPHKISDLQADNSHGILRRDVLSVVVHQREAVPEPFGFRFRTAHDTARQFDARTFSHFHVSKFGTEFGFLFRISARPLDQIFIKLNPSKYFNELSTHCFCCARLNSSFVRFRVRK